MVKRISSRHVQSAVSEYELYYSLIMIVHAFIVNRLLIDQKWSEILFARANGWPIWSF